MKIIESELWQQYYLTKDPLVKEKLIINNIVLVQKTVNKLAYHLPAHVLKDDLYSYGIFGLLEAMDRYNPDLGIPFPFFAIKRIRGAILDGMRKEDWVPVSVRNRVKMIEEAYMRIEIRTGKNASDDEIAAELRISKEELKQWLDNVQMLTVVSLDEIVNSNDDTSLRDYITDEKSPNPYHKVEQDELKALLAKAVGELPEKEKTVIALFYYDDFSNREIAKIMELSDSRVSQLHTKAIFRLRGKLARMKKNIMEVEE